MATTFDGTVTLALNPSTTTRVALAIRGLASQTGNLQTWLNSSNALLAAITATGGIFCTLPTSNPGAGFLWNDAGTVKVGT
jgi:hypothetical protein